MTDFRDFHTVKDLKFDVKKLQESLDQVLKLKKYDSANKIKDFAAWRINWDDKATFLYVFFLFTI